jgi:hypothetical protein
MTIAVANTTLSNTFSHWLARTNELADAMSTRVITVGGGVAVGNAAINGMFTANIINCDTITATDGSTEILAANLVIQSTGGLVTLGIVNIKNDIVIDAVSKIQVVGSNATHTFLAANPATGNLEFQRILIPLDQITDVDTTNAAKTNTSILMWDTTSGKWQTNTITLIDTTRINTLNVGSVSSTLTVVGNTVLSNNTLIVNGTNKRVGINISNPTSALHVNGAIQATGDIAGFQTSDRYFKKNIKEYVDKNSLDVILQLTVKEFDWDEKKVKKSKYVSPTNTGHDVALIAQEVKEVRPDWVLTREDGTLAVNYDKAIPYLIGAVKYLSYQLKEAQSGD